jgi:hypothetical protein
MRQSAANMKATEKSRRLIARLVAEATSLGQLTYRRGSLENTIEGIEVKAKDFAKRQAELLDTLRSQGKVNPIVASMAAAKRREEQDFLLVSTRNFARSRRLFIEDARVINRRIVEAQMRIRAISEELVTLLRCSTFARSTQ